MLQLSDSIANRDVLSLRTGSAIAKILNPIINPNNLKIEGFYCHSYGSKDPLILLTQDIRDVLPLGMVVNDYEDLADPDELVRLQDLIDMKFELLGKPIETTSHSKVGKVSDYAYDSSSMFIQKLYASQSILRSIAGGSLSIDRTQIHEITPKRIIINDLLNTARAQAPATA